MMRYVLLVVSLSTGLPAAEMVYFTNGHSQPVERVEREGDGIWLYAANGVTTHVAASEIGRIRPLRADGTVEPDPPQPQPVPAAFAPRQMPDEVRELVEQTATRWGVDPDLVHALVQQESNYRQRAVSHAGAIGIMQLMPGTARGLRANPWDAAENVDAGVRYLRQLLLQYRNHPKQVALALAAYNAGPNSVKRYGGIPPYRETQQYVRKVIRNYDATLVRPPGQRR